MIEDDPGVARFLERGLREAACAVDLARTGTEGSRRARQQDYDLVVLDLMLPGKDGFSILQELRADGRRVPVICLTARDQVEDRIRGLDLGADDYLVKPFALAELLARMRAVLRRSQNHDLTVIRIADLQIDPAARRVERAGRRIELSPREYALLEYLARHAGHVLSRSMLLEHVWGMQFHPGTNLVDVHINRLRKKVDHGFTPPLIHTVRGVGYVLTDQPG